MRQFAEQFYDTEIVSTLSTQLSWSHFVELLPLKNTEVKLFYANKIAEANWGVRELRKQKDNKLYERTLVANNQLPSKIEEAKNLFKKSITMKSLLDNVKLAINPDFQDWILFKNGTYVIFDNADTNKNLKDEAIEFMKKYGPVLPGGPAGDFTVIHLNRTEGWLVSGHGYGMYTYVNPKELKNDSPTDVVVGIYGRSKRDMDGQHPEVIHINRKKIVGYR